jgi:diguanylate cyclase (GGDEF)-like protein
MDRLPAPLPPASDEPAFGRVALILAGCAFAVALTLVEAFAGYLPMRTALVFCAMVAAILAGSYALMRSGVDLNRSDPNLTVAFLVLAALALAYVMYGADEAPAAIIAIYLVAFMFGVMTLDARRLVAVAVFYWLCFCAIVALRVGLRPESIDPHRAAFGAVVYFMLLAWFTAMGIYVGSLRHKLQTASASMADALAELQDLARVDSLTGCYNRRYAMELLAVEVKRVHRGQPLTLGLLDLDRFKDVNDTHGHQAGDEALAGMARTVQPLLRATDILARYGGEEFLLVLSQTSSSEALLVCERIRKAVEELRLPFLGAGERMTVSIGVAQHRDGDAVEKTLQRADTALYEAKRRGRNCVLPAQD